MLQETLCLLSPCFYYPCIVFLISLVTWNLQCLHTSFYPTLPEGQVPLLSVQPYLTPKSADTFEESLCRSSFPSIKRLCPHAMVHNPHSTSAAPLCHSLCTQQHFAATHDPHHAPRSHRTSAETSAPPEHIHIHITLVSTSTFQKLAPQNIAASTKPERKSRRRCSRRSRKVNSSDQTIIQCLEHGTQTDRHLAVAMLNSCGCTRTKQQAHCRHILPKH